MGAASVDKAARGGGVGAGKDAGVEVGAVELVQAAVTEACAHGVGACAVVAHTVDLIAAGPLGDILECGGAGVAGGAGDRVGSISADVAAGCDAAGKEGVVESWRMGDERPGRGEVTGEAGPRREYRGVMARGVGWDSHRGE
jgi:hypothetical protein